jgi:hypothetical protein
MTKIEVNITKEVLFESRNCKVGLHKVTKTGQNCAIGKAIFNLFGDKSWVTTYDIQIYKNGIEFSDKGFIENKCDIRIKLPNNASEFVRAFDNYTPERRVEIEPFSFEVEVPDEVIDMINIDEVKRICGMSPTLTLVS